MMNNRIPTISSIAIVSLISVLSGVNSRCHAYVTQHYYHAPRAQQALRSIQDINKEFYGTPVTSASADGANGTQWASPNRRTDAYSRQRDWVWVPQRHVWALRTPGARTPDRPGQRPFGPLGIGAQPQIFKTRMADGRERLTDYFGNRYKAPHSLGILK